MNEVLETIAKALVDNPEAVSVTQIDNCLLYTSRCV